MLDAEEMLDYADKVVEVLKQNDLIYPEEESSYAHFIRKTNI